MIEVKTNTKILPQNDSKILHKICGIIEVNFMTIGKPICLCDGIEIESFDIVCKDLKMKP